MKPEEIRRNILNALLENDHSNSSHIVDASELAIKFKLQSQDIVDQFDILDTKGAIHVYKTAGDIGNYGVTITGIGKQLLENYSQQQEQIQSGELMENRMIESSKKNTKSHSELSVKLYILNDEPEAIKTVIQKRIFLGKFSITEFRHKSGDSLSEGLIKEFISELDKWNAYNISFLKASFADNSILSEYNNSGSYGVQTARTIRERADKILNVFGDKVNELESIAGRMTLFAKVDKQPLEKTADKMVLGNKVFIVHGHDDGIKQTIARFLEQLKLKIVILHEQADKGKTIIEKFEKHSSAIDIGYAIILLTPDDLGRSKDGADLQPRARQNVIFELGYFISQLGRERVRVVYLEGVELPTDYQGVLYTQMDSKGAWKLELAREIKAVGIPVDATNLIEN
jgi:predicted nucleotide-binding protein